MIKERIIKYLEYKGYSKYRFYKDVGVSNGFLDKEGSVGADKCERIYHQYPDLNLIWLITGDGEMLNDKNSSGYVDDTTNQIIIDQAKQIKELRDQIGHLQSKISKTYNSNTITRSVADEDLNQYEK